MVEEWVWKGGHQVILLNQENNGDLVTALYPWCDLVTENRLYFDFTFTSVVITGRFQRVFRPTSLA